MKNFSDFGIKLENHGLIGNKISIERVLNCPIIIDDYRIADSKYKKNSKCLYLQIEKDGIKYVVFIGSKRLIETMEKVPEDGFPFKTTIVLNNHVFSCT